MFKLYAVRVADVRCTFYFGPEDTLKDKRGVVVTGASTGIGWGVSKVLADKGFHVFGTVRRQQDADRLRAELGERVTPLLMDVTEEASVYEAAEIVGKQLDGATLSGLVNNAGIAVGGPMIYLPLKDFRRQLEVNLIGPFLVTQAFAPLLGTDRKRQGKPGRIVNISSVGGKVGAPFLGAYAASKHGLEGMSESLRRELMLFGIDVVVIGPGSVITPIWDKAEAEDTSAYRDTEYGSILQKFVQFFIAESKRGLPPERIGKAVWMALTKDRPRARYAVVPQRFRNWTLPMLLPKRSIDRLIAKQFGFVDSRS